MGHPPGVAVVLVPLLGPNSAQQTFPVYPSAIPTAHLCGGSPGDTTVGGHDQNRCHVALQGPVEEGEALDVQHMHLVNEQHLGTQESGAKSGPASPRSHPHPRATQALGTHAGDDLRLALLTPFGHLGINLLADFRFDLTGVACGRWGHMVGGQREACVEERTGTESGVLRPARVVEQEEQGGEKGAAQRPGESLTREECQEALGARVDDVDLVQGHGVHHLLALLQLTVGALHELGLGEKEGRSRAERYWSGRRKLWGDWGCLGMQ